MASTILPDISSDHKAGPRISPPFKQLPPLDDPLQTKAATSLHSGTFQFVNGLYWQALPFKQEDVSSFTFDRTAGRLFFLRRSDPVVVVLDTSGNIISQWIAAQTGIKNGTVIKCRYFGNDSKSATIWVADSEDSCIRPFDVNGHPSRFIGPLYVPSKEGFVKITDISWDTVGNFYIAASTKNGSGKRIVALDSSGAHIKSGSPGLDEAQFKDDVVIAVDPISRVWVVDPQDSNVKVLSQTGSALADFNIDLPGFEIFDLGFSTVRCKENVGILYVLARKIDKLQLPGFLFLIEVTMNPTFPKLPIPQLPPLMACFVPDSNFRELSFEESGPEGYVYLLSFSPTNLHVYELGEQRPLRNMVTQPPPLWPEQFSAVLILHPFRGEEPLAIARFHYFASRSMMFDIYTEDGRHYMIVYSSSPQKSAKLSIWSKNLQWIVDFPTNVVVPAPDWLRAAGADLQGDLPLRNVPVDWWHQEFGSMQEANWHWFRRNSNHPYRTMNMDTSNPNRLPLLGDYAFIYWPYVTPRSDGIPELQKALADIKGLGKSKVNAPIYTSYIPGLLKDLSKLEGELDPSDKLENLNSVSNVIPGFKFGDGGLPLPVFPQQFFMSCTMTPVNRSTPLSTEVIYDWPRKSQRTRMFEGLEGPVIDCQLFDQTAHIFRRYENGDYKKMADIPGLGPPRPDWATAGDGKIIATITNNPVLSPNTVTRIFRNPVNPPYQFWIWYSTDDTPVVFMQTAPKVDEGTSLALADYKVMQPTGLIDPHTFDIPYSY